MISDEEVDRLATGPDAKLKRMAAEIRRLREGIRAHRDASGHALCWLNDVELWQLIGEDAAPAYPHDTLPVREEFLAQCARFHESRLTGTPYAEPQTKQGVTGRKSDKPGREPS